MTTRLLRTIAKTVAKVVPAAGAAYGLVLHQKLEVTARLDGTSTAGATDLDITGIPVAVGPSILAGDTLRIGADPTVYAVLSGVSIVAGRAGGVMISPPLFTRPTPDGTVDLFRSIDLPCQGLVTEFSAYSISQNMVRATDRKVLILVETLPAGVMPRSGDRITTPDGVVTIVAANTPGRPAVQTDPAGATHDCRCA